MFVLNLIDVDKNTFLKIDIKRADDDLYYS